MFYGSERSPQDIWASVYCLALSELVWIEEEACMTSSWWPGIVGNGKTGPTAHLTQMCANPATPGFPIPGTPEWTAKIALLKRISWDTLGRNPDTQIVSCYTSHTEKAGRNGDYYLHFIEGETEAQRNNLSLRRWLTGRGGKQASSFLISGPPGWLEITCLLFCWSCSAKLFPTVPRHGNSWLPP